MDVTQTHYGTRKFADCLKYTFLKYIERKLYNKKYVTQQESNKYTDWVYFSLFNKI